MIAGKKITWSAQAKSQLRAIDQQTAIRILHALARLVATGEGDVKRLQDIDPPEFRLRIGDYRVLFHDSGDAIEVSGEGIAAKPTARVRACVIPGDC